MWSHDAIVYQIFPDRFYNGNQTNDPDGTVNWQAKPTVDNFFGGDLEGILVKIDHLLDLGINTLYLNPIFKASTNHRYDTVDFYQIDPALGDTDFFRQFVQECHQRDIRIILDGVFNHCGSDHPFFQDVIKNGPNSPYADWFYFQGFPISSDPLNYKTCGGCSYLPKFNLENLAVQRYLLEAARYWTSDYQIDGWRLDSAQRVPHHFWNTFQREVRKINPQIYLCAELWHEPTGWFQQGLFDGASNYLLRQLLLDYFLEETIDAEDFLYELTSLYNRLGENANTMLNLVGCHDTPRINSLFAHSPEALSALLLVLFCFPGIPHIYYGDEIGLEGGKDPDCRRPMVWDESQWDLRLYEHFKALITLRKNHPALVHGNFLPLQSFNHMLAFKRIYQNEELIVVINHKFPIKNISINTCSKKAVWETIYPHGNLLYSSNSMIEVENVSPYQAMILMGR